MAKTIVIRQIGSPIRRQGPAPNARWFGSEQNVQNPRTGRHTFRARHDQQDPPHGGDR